jgi:hypothetical protein
MSSLKQLIECFEDIKSSKLANGVIRQDAVREFVDILNRAIPSQFNTAIYTIYRFNRSKYLLDKAKFVADIKDFAPYDAMILWTDFSDILAFFGLTNKIFLGWDKKNNHYRAFILQRPVVEVPVVEVPVVDSVEETVDAPIDAQTQIESPVESSIKPAPLEPIVETPTVETPTVETPTVETPIVETPSPLEPVSADGIFDNSVDAPVDVGAQVGVLSADDIDKIEDDNARVYDYMMQRIAAFTQRS